MVKKYVSWADSNPAIYDEPFLDSVEVDFSEDELKLIELTESIYYLRNNMILKKLTISQIIKIIK